jgi:hypothetical protein
VDKEMMRLWKIMEKLIIVTAKERCKEGVEQCKGLDINLTFLSHTPLLQWGSSEGV